MRIQKSHHILSLPIRHIGAARASAFTIIELVVSVGVLGILLVIAGAIFALTLKSSGQANAVIEVSRSLKALEQNLAEDLRYVQPGSSMLVIQAHKINAYWTPETKEADNDIDPYGELSGSRDPEREEVRISAQSGGPVIFPDPPRADVLMFFTSRPGSSFRYPEISGRLQQVVYGHAEIGNLNSVTGVWEPTSAQFDEGYDIQGLHVGTGGPTLIPENPPAPFIGDPARLWHLARRSVLIVDQSVTAPGYFPARDPDMVDLNDDAGLAGVDEDDPAYSALTKRFFIRDGRRDFVVNTNGVPARFSFKEDVMARPPNVSDDLNSSNDSAVVNWMYRSWIDPEVPAQQSARLGAFMLPNCASFKVEWALDVSDIDLTAFAQYPEVAAGLDRILGTDVLWVDPYTLGALVVRIQSIPGLAGNDFAVENELTQKVMLPIRNRFVPQNTNDSAPGAPGTTRFLDGFTPGDTELKLRRTHVFYSSDPNKFRSGDTAANDTPDLLFPKALRITVDLYDSANRLERPIRHVMVLPVGGG